MKYTVHLYYAVRISMEDIEADSQEEAFAKAQEECDVKSRLDYREFEDEEAPALGAMIDEVGDEDEYGKTRYHEGPGATLYLASDGIEHALRKIRCLAEEAVESDGRVFLSEADILTLANDALGIK